MPSLKALEAAEARKVEKRSRKAAEKEKRIGLATHKEAVQTKIEHI